MARARNIKPSLFKNEILGEADLVLTVLFQGLWCLADREGRLEDRPKRIKAEIFPYRELPDINGYLTELERLGFIRRYVVGEIPIIQVINFLKHQSPHKTEKPSELPKYRENSDSCPITDIEPLNHQSKTVKESLIPDSLNLIPDSKRGARFVKPTFDELVAEFQNRVHDPTIQAQKFLSHYESNGWRVGKNPMKSWTHAVTNWITRSQENAISGRTYQTKSERADEAARNALLRAQP